MIFVPRDASNEQVIDMVRNWIEILMREDYQAAFDAIADQTPGKRWTPDYIKNDIKNYRSPDFYPGVQHFQVTDWRTATGGDPNAVQTVRWYQPSASCALVGDISFDLPLNGQWSNLTADFAIWDNANLEEGYFLDLEEISSYEQHCLDDGLAEAEPSAV